MYQTVYWNVNAADITMKIIYWIFIFSYRFIIYENTVIDGM